MPSRRSVRIGVSWTPTSDEDDVEIFKVISHHQEALRLGIASVNLGAKPAVYGNEGSRDVFTSFDRIAIGDFLDWAADSITGFATGEFSITGIVDEYQEMIRSAQTKPHGGGGGNS